MSPYGGAGEVRQRAPPHRICGTYTWIEKPKRRREIPLISTQNSPDEIIVVVLGQLFSLHNLAGLPYVTCPSVPDWLVG